jgi:NAD(P)-dependent dehydrogenase (short-subunit alcohol dehydrogenase family)
MLALTTPEMAAKAGFTVLALLDTGTEAAQEVTIPVAHAGAEPVNYRGAQGGAVVAAALRGAAGTKGASAVSWPRPAGEAVWRFLPPRSAEEGNPGPAEPAQQPNSAASGFVTDTPITFHRPELFPAPARPGAFDLRERKILFVTDRPELIAEGAGDLAGLSYAVLAPGTATSDSGAGMSLESDDLLKQSLKLLAPASFDCIVAVTSLAGVSPLALLERPYGEQNDFTGLLFGITRHAYAEIRSGKVPMACLCLGGGSADGRPHPASGLAVGFMKSIIRELPEALCRFIGTTEVGMAAALPQVAAELAQGCPGGLAAEFWYLDGKRHQVKLVTQMAADGQAVPQLTKESVVLVTGGGRGVTAVLVEAILKQWGCTAVLLGRTDLGGVPRHILDMDEATFAAHETEFYREGLAATPGIKIPELKRRYQAHLAARELQGVITRLSALPGRIEYVSGDVTSTDALDMVVAGIADRHGRLDMVIHGAGIQSSKRLPSRRLEEFEAIIGTKLTGLHAIHSACRRHFPARLIDFHLLTSAFSYIGNDGQPDYGAANETMNRLAGWIDGRLGWGRWSTMAWLGWDGIGMTRGSEYSALAAGRRIRGITAPEGEKIFLDFLSKAPPSPVTIPLTEGEIELFGIEIVEAEGASRPGGPGEAGVETITWPISLERHPHFRLHQIRGLPTVPGTFELELAARAARARAPELAVHGFTDCVFHRFVRLRDGEETELRTVSEWLDGDGDEARYRIAVLSDFRHESGVVLQRDVLHIECIVHMTRFPPASLESVVPDLAVRNGTPAPDPYTHPDAPVNHQGLFRHLHDVSLGEGLKEARFILGGDRALDTETEHLTPWLLSDACLSFSMLEINSEGMMPVFVPLRIGSIRFVPGLHDWNIHRLHGEVRLVAPNRPRSRESETREVQTATWVQVVGADDRVLAIVDGAVGRLFKMVPPTMDAGANPDLALA